MKLFYVRLYLTSHNSHLQNYSWHENNSNGTSFSVKIINNKSIIKHAGFVMAKSEKQAKSIVKKKFYKQHIDKDYDIHRILASIANGHSVGKIDFCITNKNDCLLNVPSKNEHENYVSFIDTMMTV